MSEDKTKDLDKSKSFEAQVFARFDSMDARFERVEGRLSAVEIRITKLEDRQYDTKPIWERVLLEIEQLKAAINETNESIAGVRTELRAEISETNESITNLRTELKAEISETNESITNLRTELKAEISETNKSITNLRTELKADIAAMNESIRNDLEHELRGVGRKLDALNHSLLEIQADQRYVDRRLQKLEEQT